MKAELVYYGGWDLALFCARMTRNKNTKFVKGLEPSLEFKKRLLISRHSPVREVKVVFKLEVPNKSQNHLVRHNLGIGWYVTTLRQDWTDAKDIEVTRLTDRTLSVSMNLESFINVCHARTCKVAEDSTREITQLMIDEFVSLNTELVHSSFFQVDCSKCKESFSDCNGERFSVEKLDKILGVKNESKS